MARSILRRISHSARIRPIGLGKALAAEPKFRNAFDHQERKLAMQCIDQRLRNRSGTGQEQNGSCLFRKRPWPLATGSAAVGRSFLDRRCNHRCEQARIELQVSALVFHVPSPESARFIPRTSFPGVPDNCIGTSPSRNGHQSHLPNQRPGRICIQRNETIRSVKTQRRAIRRQNYHDGRSHVSPTDANPIHSN